MQLMLQQIILHKPILTTLQSDQNGLANSIKALTNDIDNLKIVVAASTEKLPALNNAVINALKTLNDAKLFLTL